ncbi:sulfotransferase ssu-1-like [Parasteatoda tepidariorum]|uniref:sulfotransferase ssu-1-like n=1 Tax=Parasteatoda tepidariorum TaxID=114398 RepID=UPI00077FCBA7|nr:sulfotransferase ssu-1-like [Parasteatoda tepidariorum]
MAFITSKKKPSYFTYSNGFIIPQKLYIPGHLEESLTYKPKDDDVFIATYPKCGTTWTQYILYLMLSNGVPLSSDEDFYSISPHLEDNGKQAVNSRPSPRLIKTHLPYHLVPKSNKARYIYITRNPKDCCVSFYYHTIGFGKVYDFEGGTFDDFFDVFFEGSVDGGDYFDHLLSYYRHRNDPNVLFLLYEELIRDCEECVLRIGNFLGGPFSDAINDPKVLQNVLKYSSFHEMKKLPLWTNRPKDLQFIRKGIVGDWKSCLSKEQSEKLDQKFNSKLNGTGAENLWQNLC